MQFDTTTIDQIVAGVLTQLAGDDDGASVEITAEITSKTRKHSGNEGIVRPEIPPANGIGATIITASVITEAVLLQGLHGEKCVTVSEGAIVTPAAWDAAREMGIEVLRQNSRAPSGKTNLNGSTSRIQSHTSTKTQGGENGGLRPLLIVVRSTDAVTRLSEDLQSTWRRELLGCPDDAAALAVSAICRGESKSITILAEQAHRAACLANRNDRIKAVAIRDAGEIAVVKRQLRANVWCIDPSGKSWFELRNLMRGISSSEGMR